MQKEKVINNAEIIKIGSQLMELVSGKYEQKCSNILRLLVQRVDVCHLNVCSQTYYLHTIFVLFAEKKMSNLPLS